MLRFLLLVLLSAGAYGATRDVPLEWQHDCTLVSGDTLDEDGDGTCEQLNWHWRAYTEEGGFITAWAEDGLRARTIRYNMEWGATCHKMTAVIDDPLSPGEVKESAYSNIGRCATAIPGNPKEPLLIEPGG